MMALVPQVLVERAGAGNADQLTAADQKRRARAVRVAEVVDRQCECAVHSRPELVQLPPTIRPTALLVEEPAAKCADGTTCLREYSSAIAYRR